MIAEEKQKLESEANAFDQLFASLPNESDEVAAPVEVDGIVD